jgi:hypothetical protein
MIGIKTYPMGKEAMLNGKRKKRFFNESRRKSVTHYLDDRYVPGIVNSGKFILPYETMTVNFSFHNA